MHDSRFVPPSPRARRFYTPARSQVAVDETVILLHPPLPLVGVSIGMERELQQHDSLVMRYSQTAAAVRPSSLTCRWARYRSLWFAGFDTALPLPSSHCLPTAPAGPFAAFPRSFHCVSPSSTRTRRLPLLGCRPSCRPCWWPVRHPELQLSRLTQAHTKQTHMKQTHMKSVKVAFVEHEPSSPITSPRHHFHPFHFTGNTPTQQTHSHEASGYVSGCISSNACPTRWFGLISRRAQAVVVDIYHNPR